MLVLPHFFKLGMMIPDTVMVECRKGNNSTILTIKFVQYNKEDNIHESKTKISHNSSSIVNNSIINQFLNLSFKRVKI